MQHYRIDHAGSAILAGLPDGLFYGTGVFTTFKAIPGEIPFRLEAHYERLKRDSAFFSLAFPWEEFTAFKTTLEAFCHAHLSDSQVLRVSVIPDTFGGHDASAKTVCYVSMRACPAPVEAVALKTVRFNRLFPQHKHGSHIAESVYLPAVKQQGFDDYLRLSEVGSIAESAYANVFLVLDGHHLLTPDIHQVGCLPGIMRQAVIEACADSGIQVEAGQYPLEKLSECRGLFLTNAVRGIIPVSRVDAYHFNWEALQPVITEIRRSLRSRNTPLPWR